MMMMIMVYGVLKVVVCRSVFWSFLSVPSRSNGGVVCGQETSVSKSREQQRANSQPTPTHAGAYHKLSAAAAFGAPIPNFGGGGVLKLRRRRRDRRDAGLYPH